MQEKIEPQLADSPPSMRLAWLGLLLLVPAPSIGVACAMHYFPGSVGQAIYGLSKVWILIVPAVWHFLINRRGLEIHKTTEERLALGVFAGAMIFAGVSIIYWLFGNQFIDANHLRDVAKLNGLDQLWKYIVLAFYLTVINSLLEEYVWRWFVLDGLRAMHLPDRLATIVAGLLFAAHHLVALKLQGSWSFALICSFGVFIGGWVWGELRLRTGSIWPGYVSHLIVDSVVFIIGYKIIFGV